MIETETPDHLLVKCVVVGNTGVGKTRLVAAHACGARVSLSNCLGTHVPTVWAIDQYRLCPEVLQRSYHTVDGVDVSLRLWDTFGYHGKDRRFAYGRANVVLLCFSIASLTSLKQVKTIWLPEIRQYCPQAPIVLCGCQNDLRFTDLGAINKLRGPLSRPIYEKDLIPAEMGRRMAREIGVPYYESSVLTLHGVDETFTNVVRAALVSRRHTRFWISSLKRVLKPQLQAPYLPPKPTLTCSDLPPSTHRADLSSLVDPSYWGLADLVFRVQGQPLLAHKIILAAVSPALLRIFQMDMSQCFCQTAPDEGQPGQGQGLTLEPCPGRPIESPVVQLAHLQLQKEGGDAGEPIPFHRCPVQTVLVVRTHVSVALMKLLLRFIYTGRVDEKKLLESGASLSELSDLALKLGLEGHSLNFNPQLTEDMNSHLSSAVMSARFLSLADGVKSFYRDSDTKLLFTDIAIRTSDGVVQAHRIILMARCQIMARMLGGMFMETSSEEVYLPITSSGCLETLLDYLYTDQCPGPGLSLREYLELIELANYLCLPGLVALMEPIIIQELQSISEDKEDDGSGGGGGILYEHLLNIVTMAQMHNADYLYRWCLNCLATSYDLVFKVFRKQLESLSPEDKCYLEKHQWPPQWYQTEIEYYTKSKMEREREALSNHRKKMPKCCWK